MALITSCGVRARDGSRLGIHPDAHRVLCGAEDRHIADALEASQLVLHVDHGVVRQKQPVEAALRRNECDDFEELKSTSSPSGHALGLDLLRQRGQWRRPPGGGRRICALSGSVPIANVTTKFITCRHPRWSTACRACPSTPLTLLLDRQRNGVNQGLGARARIQRFHLYGRRHDIGILGGRQLQQRDQDRLGRRPTPARWRAPADR